MINKIITEPETDVEIAVGVENASGIMLLLNGVFKAGNLDGFITEKDHACVTEESFENVGKNELLKLVMRNTFHN